MYTLSSPIVTAEAVDDTAAYLRLSNDEELTLIAALLSTAILQCESFCGQILLRRTGVEDVRATGTWQLLGTQPIRSISSVTSVDLGGVQSPIPAAHYAIDIDDSGAGWVRVNTPGILTRIRINFEAGIADGWADLPAPLRQGMIRLVAHLHASRDSVTDAGPPAIVAALWRPHRRMRLGSRHVA
jgi:uncharacterized phiE125 gp8 family phage protein